MCSMRLGFVIGAGLLAFGITDFLWSYNRMPDPPSVASLAMLIRESKSTDKEVLDKIIETANASYRENIRQYAALERYTNFIPPAFDMTLAGIGVALIISTVAEIIRRINSQGQP